MYVWLFRKLESIFEGELLLSDFWSKSEKHFFKFIFFYIFFYNCVRVHSIAWFLFGLDFVH